jgi:DNA replication factor GINS
VITTKIKAINRVMMLTTKKVLVLDDWGPYDNGFEEIVLSKGSEDEVSTWLGIVLQERNVVKITDVISIDELGRILFQEKQTINTPASLSALPKDFYHRVQLLRDELKRKNDLQALELLRKLDQVVNEIVSIRIRKIMQLAFLNISDESLIDRMTNEEFLVYKTIKSVIERGIGDIIGS